MLVPRLVALGRYDAALRLALTHRAAARAFARSVRIEVPRALLLAYAGACCPRTPCSLADAHRYAGDVADDEAAPLAVEWACVSMHPTMREVRASLRTSLRSPLYAQGVRGRHAPVLSGTVRHGALVSARAARLGAAVEDDDEALAPVRAAAAGFVPAVALLVHEAIANGDVGADIDALLHVAAYVLFGGRDSTTAGHVPLEPGVPAGIDTSALWRSYVEHGPPATRAAGAVRVDAAGIEACARYYASLAGVRCAREALLVDAAVVAACARLARATRDSTYSVRTSAGTRVRVRWHQHREALMFTSAGGGAYLAVAQPVCDTSGRVGAWHVRFAPAALCLAPSGRPARAGVLEVLVRPCALTRTRPALERARLRLDDSTRAALARGPRALVGKRRLFMPE